METRDFSSYQGILVFGKMLPSGPAEGFLELLGEATRLKAQMTAPVRITAACLGSSMEGYLALLFHHGADHVCCIDHPSLGIYQPHRYTEGLFAIIQQVKPDIVLACASYEGGEVASAVAARLGTGLAAHSVSLKFIDGEFIQVVPAFAGKIYGDILCPDTRPRMSTIKEGMFQKLPKDNTRTGTVERIELPPCGFDERIELLSVEDEAKGTEKSLTEADFVIGGGLGIGGSDKWRYLEQLAEVAGAALGCTRPALDQHWVHNEKSMIGTSGVIVKPKLYLSVGISGAAHHVCGVNDAEVTIAINNDPNATIFSHADFGICEDWEKIIPLLIDKISMGKEG